MRHPVGVLHTPPTPMTTSSSMPPLLGSVLKFSATLLEAGLDAVDQGATAVRARLDSIAGASTPATNAPPLDGPRNLDSALSDFANQMVRMAWISAPGGVPLGQMAGEILKSARRSFGYLNPQDPRILGLALELPFSVSGLAAETMLRMIALLSSVGTSRLPVFMNDAIELYVETAVFISLEYPQLIERYSKQLQSHPQDSTTRLELGRLYLKCGRYDDAVRELDIAAGDAGILPRARAESAVAHLRAGRFRQSVADAVEAMTADPGNERARVNMW